MYGALIGAGMHLATTAINNQIQEQQQGRARLENYKYGELAASKADQRTRALYNDFYSPEALLKQYEKAGLSPSMMFGGTPGQGGVQGAQGSGAAGLPALYTPYSMLEGAQTAALIAQTEKTKAETQNIETDTQRSVIQKGIEELQATKYQNEYAIINSTWTENGKQKSIFEAAQDHYTYESFLNWCREGDTDESIKKATTTEAGQKILRDIYVSASHFNRDISVLTEETISSNFQISIINALKSHNFEQMNAETAVSQLKQEVATNELTESQKQAWNNLINKLGKKGSTGRDIAIVLGMILGNFASHTGIKVNLGK